MYKSLLGLLIIISAQAFAAETVIQGKSTHFEGKTIRLAYFEDYITLKKAHLDETQIADKKYHFTIDLEKSKQLVLKVEDKEATFFAEGGNVYNLNLSYDEEKNRGRAFDKVLDLQFSFPQASEMNQLIKKFNQDYSAFFRANIKKFATKTATKEVKQFIAEQSEIKAYKSHPFVSNYVTYVLANLEDINHTSEDKLFEKYLKNKEVLHENKEYMNFFKQLYQKDFERLSLSKSGAEILKAIMLEESLSKTIDLIKKDKGFEQNELAELYLIYGLFETYHLKTVSPKSNLKMLELLSKNGSTPSIQLTAKNVIESLKKFDNNGMAANFELKDENGMLVKLTDFKDKPIYLNFWADWSIPSLRQLSVMQKLHEKYGEKIHFVSINLDEDPSKMNDYLKLKNFKWTFLHYGNDYEVREKYNVRTVPSYFLIDENGKFIQVNAPDPTEVERRLYEISK